MSTSSGIGGPPDSHNQLKAFKPRLIGYGLRRKFTIRDSLTDLLILFPSVDNVLHLILDFQGDLRDASRAASFDGLQPNFVFLSLVAISLGFMLLIHLHFGFRFIWCLKDTVLGI